jgi:hypothetical protein
MQAPIKAQIQPMLSQDVKVPILGMSWQVDAPALLLACGDNSIKKWDLASNTIQTIGEHRAPVKEVVNI